MCNVLTIKYCLKRLHSSMAEYFFAKEKTLVSNTGATSSCNVMIACPYSGESVGLIPAKKILKSM